MSRFSDTLNQLMGERDFSQSELADLSGLPRLTIHRLKTLNGRPCYDHQTGLFNAFPDPLDRYRLIRAFMQDELPEEGFNSLQLTPAPTSRKRQPPAAALEILPRSIRSSLEFLIGLYDTNPHIGEIIVGVSKAFQLVNGHTKGAKRDNVREVRTLLKKPSHAGTKIAGGGGRKSPRKKNPSGKSPRH